MFSALACVAFAFSGFASNEVVNLDGAEQTTNCRWRTVYTQADGAISYGPWTYGECNKTVHEDGSTTLQPIGISRN